MVLLIITEHLNTLDYNYVDSNSKRKRHRCLLLSCLLSFFWGRGRCFGFFLTGMARKAMNASLCLQDYL